MEGLWVFCPSSEPYITQCLESAGKGKTNKWTRALNPEVIDLSDETENFAAQNDTNNISAECTMENTTKNEAESVENVIEICEIIETDLLNRFEFITYKLSENPTLFSHIALKITQATAEKLCNMIIESKNLENTFILGYMQIFLPTFLRQEPTRFTVEILMKTYEKQPLEFKKSCLPAILKDVRIPNTVFLGFVNLIAKKDQLDILNCLTEIELDSNQFLHHLNTVICLYKSCDRTQSIDNYILSILIRSSESCTNNKNFGQLLFAYLASKDCNYKMIENVIENHNSAFRRPCLNLLRKFNT